MTRTKPHTITVQQFEEIMSLAADMASSDQDGGINSDMLANYPFMMHSDLNRSERHYVQRAMDQLRQDRADAKADARREASRICMARYWSRQRALYSAQTPEYRSQFTQLGHPRKALGPNGAITRLIRETTKYRNLSEVRSAVQRGEITHGSLPTQLQQRIPKSTGTGNGINHKKQYGETLEQMGKRLGISREAVRTRIQRWGSPEHSAKPSRVLSERTYSSPTSFISARLLRVWGYDSITQLAQQPDSELLGLWAFGPNKLKRLRALYPTHTEVAL